MALFDIFKKGSKGGKKRKAEEKLKRPSKGVLKRVEKNKGFQPEAVSAEKKEKKTISVENESELASKVISSPHITEKATFLSEKGVYVFKVMPKANKVMVRRAVKELYGFEPWKVSIVNISSKTRLSRGKKGVKSGYKKAMVYLKEGDKIELA